MTAASFEQVLDVAADKLEGGDVLGVDIFTEDSLDTLSAMAVR